MAGKRFDDQLETVRMIADDGRPVALELDESEARGPAFNELDQCPPKQRIPTPGSRREEIQQAEYRYPYHYADVFGIGQSIERMSIFKGLADELIRRGETNVLDVGCGDGRFCHYARRHLAVEGVDNCARAIQWARAFNPDVTFYDAELADVRGTYDAAVCIEVLEHIPDDAIGPFLAELSKLVVPGGTIIFTVPSVRLPLQEKHYRHYDEPLLRSTLAGRFELESIKGHSRDGRRIVRMLFALLNMVSVLSYSDTVRYRWTRIFERLARTKESFWQKYLHEGPPHRCYRLVAVCTNRRS